MSKLTDRTLKHVGLRLTIATFLGFALLSSACDSAKSTANSNINEDREQVLTEAMDQLEAEKQSTAEAMEQALQESMEQAAAEANAKSRAMGQLLSVGDPAPPLAIAQWVKGEPIEEFEPGQVYVVEFWATWCGPCLRSMPHISSLQESYGDAVRFVGITREDEATVNGFLAKGRGDETWDEIITYRLALDSSSQTNTNYMKAAKRPGIPCAFIVGKSGLIEWIGHPNRIDQPLEQVVNDGVESEAAVAAE